MTDEANDQKAPETPTETAAAPEVVAETPAPTPETVKSEPIIHLVPSYMKPTLGGPTNPSYDADKLDSTGKNEKSGEVLGPRGADKPGDVMSDDERAAIAKKREDRLAKGMSPTHSTDSTGNPKGHFATIPQGNDKHGARIPDQIDYSTVVEPHLPTLGPRGPGAPKDTFHKK